jgi:hypothetical protein
VVPAPDLVIQRIEDLINRSLTDFEARS